MSPLSEQRKHDDAGNGFVITDEMVERAALSIATDCGDEGCFEDGYDGAPMASDYRDSARSALEAALGGRA